MSHGVIIIQLVILPPSDSQVAAVDGAAGMTAEVRYTPAHGETAAQIGNRVERICKRLERLADD